jgi:hypothetical protein
MKHEKICSFRYAISAEPWSVDNIMMRKEQGFIIVGKDR